MGDTSIGAISGGSAGAAGITSPGPVGLDDSSPTVASWDRCGAWVGIGCVDCVRWFGKFFRRMRRGTMSATGSACQSSDRYVAKRNSVGQRKESSTKGCFRQTQFDQPQPLLTQSQSGARLASSSRRTRRSIFPDAVLGIASQRITAPIFLYSKTRSASHALISSGSNSLRPTM